MRRKKRIPSFVIPLGISLLLGYLVYNLMNSKTAPAVITKQVEVVKYKDVNSTEILVATNDIPVGKLLSHRDFAWRKWPDTLLNDKYVQKDEQNDRILKFIGTVTRLPLSSGEPFTESKIIIPGDRSILSGLLRDGMRALTISVDSNTAQSSFIRPGDYVDILITHGLKSIRVGDNNIDVIPLDIDNAKKQNDRKNNKKNNLSKYNNMKDGKPDVNLPSEDFYDKISSEDNLVVAGSSKYTRLLMSDVRILAINQDIKFQNNSESNVGRQENANLVTVEVTLEQAKLLTWAEQTGNLTIVLKGLVENSVEGDERPADLIPEVQLGEVQTYKQYIEDLEKTNSSGKDGVTLIRSGSYSTIQAPTKKQDERN